MTNITSGTLRERRQHTVTSKSHFDAQGIALHHDAFIGEAAMHSSFVEIGQKRKYTCPSLWSREGCRLLEIFCFYKGLPSSALGNGHHSPLERWTPPWYASWSIVNRFIRKLLCTMWVSSMKHLRYHGPFSFLSKNRGSYFMPPVSPCFIRTDFTQHSRLTSPAYYLRAPATPRHIILYLFLPHQICEVIGCIEFDLGAVLLPLQAYAKFKSTQQDSYQQGPCLPHPLSSSFFFFP